jgi:hypothetical protein
MRYAFCVLLVIACGSPEAQHGRELAACQLISKSGDDLAACLIMKYNWGADSAGPAKTAWQRQLDSIRLEHEAQAVAVLTQQEAVVARQRAERLLPLSRKAAPWARCMMQQPRDESGSIFMEKCDSIYRPSFDELDAYIQMHHPRGDTSEILYRAHVESVP